MARSIEHITANQELELADLQVHRHYFSEEICRLLHEYILDQPTRKVIHHITDPTYDVPAEVSAAFPLAPFSSSGNTVITKRYTPGEPSAAHITHQDPEEFKGDPFVLATFGGRAILSVFSKKWQLDIECVRNTVIVVHNHPAHMVSPPLGEETRTFMFSGNDHTQPDRFDFLYPYLRDDGYLPGAEL